MRLEQRKSKYHLTLQDDSHKVRNRRVRGKSVKYRQFYKKRSCWEKTIQQEKCKRKKQNVKAKENSLRRRMRRVKKKEKRTKGGRKVERKNKKEKRRKEQMKYWMYQIKCALTGYKWKEWYNIQSFLFYIKTIILERSRISSFASYLESTHGWHYMVFIFLFLSYFA